MIFYFTFYNNLSLLIDLCVYSHLVYKNKNQNNKKGSIEYQMNQYGCSDWNLYLNLSSLVARSMSKV